MTVQPGTVDRTQHSGQEQPRRNRLQVPRQNITVRLHPARGQFSLRQLEYRVRIEHVFY